MNSHSRRGIQLGKFVRQNIKRSSAVIFANVLGLRVGASSNGSRSRFAGESKCHLEKTPRSPLPGIFAPAHEKEFFAAVRAHQTGSEGGALQHLLKAAPKEPCAAILAAVFIAKKSGGANKAISILEKVVQSSDQEFPTRLTQKYLRNAEIGIYITPHVYVHVPVDGFAASLLLVGLYQGQGQLRKAIELLEEIASLTSVPAITLALCELYVEAENWDGVIERFTGKAKDREPKPEDKLLLHTMVLVGYALYRKGHYEAAFRTLTAVLNVARDPILYDEWRDAYYWYAVSYEVFSCEILGKKNQIENLRTRVHAEPANADLHFELALKLLAAGPVDEYSTLEYENSTVFQELRAWRFFSPAMKEAKDELTLALATGLSNPLKAAKARFLLVELSMSEAGMHSQTALEKLPNLRALAQDIVSNTNRYLHRYPHNINALTLQGAAYAFIGNHSGVGRVQQALSEARSLLEAGLITNEEAPIQDETQERKRKDGIALEETTKRLLQAMGLKAATTKVSGDGGIDVVAYSESPIFAGKYIVQCKDWTNPVGEPVVRDLFGVVMSEGANKGILITTGHFTSTAESFAAGKPLELIDGNSLRKLLKQYSIRQEGA